MNLSIVNDANEDDARLNNRVDDWKNVNPVNRFKKRIVGNNANSTIRGVPKLSELHVCRLDKTTLADDPKNILRKSFNVVDCEAMTSRYRQVYPTFKVTIHEQSSRLAMNPNFWPERACVIRLFEKRFKDSKTDK
ncbi:hypothetical protein JTB14_022825 [Gonioctena quinquepunctata]|nr:hypothetical protein JTB14_022825 [Gonioctena quinquepunctata]